MLTRSTCTFQINHRSASSRQNHSRASSNATRRVRSLKKKGKDAEWLLLLSSRSSGFVSVRGRLGLELVVGASGGLMS